jgi:hypothetical protein
MWKVPLVRDNGIWERGCHGPYVGSSSGTRDSWPRPTPFCYCISWWLLLNSYSLTIGGFMTYRHLSALNIGYAGDCWRARGNLTTEVTCGDTTFCATGLMEMKRMSTCLGIGASYCNWRYTLQRQFHWDVRYQPSRSSRSCRKCYRAVILHLSYLLPFHSLPLSIVFFRRRTMTNHQIHARLVWDAIRDPRTETIIEYDILH